MTENVSIRHWTCHTGSSWSMAFQGGILSSFWPSVATYIITIINENGFKIPEIVAKKPEIVANIPSSRTDSL